MTATSDFRAFEVSAGKSIFALAPNSNSNYATVNIGSGGFIGAGGGFNGSSSGTSLGINEASGYAGNLVDFQVNGSSMFKLTNSGNINFGGDLTFLEAKNMVVGTTTGTQIGTSTSQMLGFLGATPVVQQTGGAATAGVVYTATEQTMLQAAYNCLRTFGFLS